MSSAPKNNNDGPSQLDFSGLSQIELEKLYDELIAQEQRQGVIDITTRAALYEAMDIDPVLQDYYHNQIASFISENLSDPEGDYFKAYAHAHKNWDDMSDEARLAFLKDHIQKLSECFGFKGAPTLSVKNLGHSAGAVFIEIIDPPFGHMAINQSHWDGFDFVIYGLNHEYAHSVSHVNSLRIPSERRDKLSSEEKKLLPELPRDHVLYGYHKRNRLNIPGLDRFSFYFSSIVSKAGYRAQPEERQARFLGYHLRDESNAAVRFTQRRLDPDVFVRDLYTFVTTQKRLSVAFAGRTKSKSEGASLVYAPCVQKALDECGQLQQELLENRENQPLDTAARLLGVMTFLAFHQEYKMCKTAKDKRASLKISASARILKIEQFFYALQELDKERPDLGLMMRALNAVDEYDEFMKKSSDVTEQSIRRAGATALPQLWPVAKHFEHVGIRAVRPINEPSVVNVIRPQVEQVDVRPSA